MLESFAVSCFNRWLESNRKDFERFTLREEFSARPGRSSNIQIETPTHIISLCAWDQGNALEIQVIDLSSEATNIEDGACETENELMARLALFLGWIEQIHE